MIEGHVFIATSMDGYIARPDGGLDWLDVAGTEDDHGYADFMSRMDGLIMGRVTFETVLGFGDWPYDKPVVVLSRRTTSLPAHLEGRVTITAEPPRQVMNRLGQEGWRRAYIDGGRVITSFLDERLVTELTVTRIPVLLGAGIPLFGALRRDITLTHLETRNFPTGLVQSRYAIVPMPG
ncbi:dihydrofolate reductase family protein [Maritimibacter sp. DP1N21-5]|uniref:dihydrofolate reductase family protein n=1 Tax=Maritimibacter sp. DP1N21-5 TaxID=2836867 RepID=UPI001C480993|nr:dihydrofolate reductase family protein [Maritimibacter sp. DP1N21-5]MBV7410883.1 dihydrofolate reductase family protein [Maritimibacter sp. DP1N21-5]